MKRNTTIKDTGKTRATHQVRLVHPNGKVETKEITGDYTKADAKRAGEVVDAGGTSVVNTKDGRQMVSGRRD
jgi:hypothetical protein